MMSAARPTLRLGGVPEHFNLPWHLAMESSELSDLELTWADQPGGTGAMLTQLEDADIDIVSILTEGTVLAIDKGADLRILQVFVQSPLRWGVHVPAASSLEEFDDAEHARIAISRFRSGSHLMPYVLAGRMGWTLADDQFVVVGGLEGARTAFAAQEAELFLWDRFMTQVLVDAGEFRRIGVQETPWPSFVIAAREEVVQSNPAAVERVVDAVMAEAAQLHGRPTIIEDLTSRYDIDAITAQSWLEVTEFASRGPVDDEMLTSTLGTLRRAGF